MSLYPRSATVRAKTDCVMLEMLRNVLDVIQRNKTLRAELEKNYRKRALEDHLRTVPLFSTLSPDFIDAAGADRWSWSAIREARCCAARATPRTIFSWSASAS